ncbi:WYL domain-containing protein [Muricauda sp. TY007]|uniref:helix-turn-helix transcriptional regulator n=1 Tax=Allomuricauda sp. TY007 TaxID=2683200 RepID=UPI0013C20D42|nr:WYL domain-containing protein [Muricauda sp. TY007]NDV15722.1 WYL domain-containing protein [Muricauda sp. TY007]
MATNKHATIRYNTLDRCFSNPGKRYYIEDLLDACNEALFEYDPDSNGIKRRQLFEDIKFMESIQGWNIPLDKIKDGRRVYYRYKESSFSINNSPLNEMEAEKLKSAMLVLNRFKGLPQFEWVNELIPKLDQTFNLYGTDHNIISFETNDFLKGTEYITPLFNAIRNRQSLRIDYQSFKRDKLTSKIFYPYHLKEYNNRWFVLGLEKENNKITNYALDRIQDLEEFNDKYNDSLNLDFNEFFEDIIGVSKPYDGQLIKIEMMATKELAPYIKTKPIHGSQRRISDDESGFTFMIEVIPNFELIRLILSFGAGLTVISPLNIRDEVIGLLNTNLNNY